MKEKMRKDSLGSDTSSNADKKLQNQFSFVERATQTMNNSLKVQKNIILKVMRSKQSFTGEKLLIVQFLERQIPIKII